MHVIKGGIKIGKGIDSSKLIKKMEEADVKIKLPFEATGFRSTNKVLGIGGGFDKAPVEKIKVEKPVIAVAPVKGAKPKYDRKALASMKMSELRDIGDKYGVKDNIKSELIDKILKAVKK